MIQAYVTLSGCEIKVISQEIVSSLGGFVWNHKAKQGYRTALGLKETPRTVR